MPQKLFCPRERNCNLQFRSTQHSAPPFESQLYFESIVDRSIITRQLLPILNIQNSNLNHSRHQEHSNVSANLEKMGPFDQNVFTTQYSSASPWQIRLFTTFGKHPFESKSGGYWIPACTSGTSERGRSLVCRPQRYRLAGIVHR